MKKSINTQQLNILLNIVEQWAIDRREKFAASSVEAIRKRSAAIEEGFKSSAITIIADKESRCSHYFYGEDIEILFRGKLDRKNTPKELVALLDAQRKEQNGPGESMQTTIHVPWSRGGFHQSICCLKTDAAKVEKTIALLTEGLLGGDASDIARKIRSILK